MDAIEVARQRAEQLHADAVLAGQNPWKPYAFVRFEASRRQLAVERVQPGDVRLFGGRAVYDPDALLILHEETGDDFSNAFLVAHEIGHVEFGGEGQWSEVLNPDPLRSSEAVPIGIDRVADYSQRQRREVQMDLFAREFLLPRCWARALHVNDGRTASGIAAELGAPPGVVAQQLFDALFLPTVEAGADEPRTEKPLNPEQKSAAVHWGPAYLLEAGPGTGKTQTLVSRVTFLLERGVEPRHILVLTFSNKAAGELSSRIASKHAGAAASMWVGTFHSFGLDIIRRFHERLSLPADPRLIDRTDAVELLEKEWPTLNLVHFKNLQDPSRPLAEILAAISRANDEVADAATYKTLAEQSKNTASDGSERETASRCLEVAEVFAAYERAKAAAGCIDFGDLVSKPVRLCEVDAEVREYLASHYEHVLVDEYQDVNRSSVRLLKAIAGDGAHLWAVGDAKQSIYRFRGASAYNMDRFDREDFKVAHRGRLATNYRSHAEVVETFSTFASQMPEITGAASDLGAERGRSFHRPEYRAVETANDEIAAVAETIEEMRSAGHKYRDQAVLCSGNDRLARFAEGLERLGIPILYLGSLFERDEIKDLLCVLSILVDRRAMGLVKLGTNPVTSVGLGDVATLLGHLKDNVCEPMKWTEVLDSIGELSPASRVALRHIAGLVADFPPHSNPWIVLCSVLLDRTRIAAEIASSNDVAARSRGVAIWQFMNFVRTQPAGAGFPISRLLQRIRRLVLFSDERDLRHLPAAAQGIDAVRFMTMHGSKGLEFPVVHLPGLTKASLPRSPNAMLARVVAPPNGLIAGAEEKAIESLKNALSAEQECLFFVALSRCRDRLFLYSPTKTAAGKSCPRSPFIDRLGDRIALRQVTPAKALPPSELDAPVRIKLEGNFAFSDHQLALVQRCPRRFLYTHLLNVGGRRAESAFMRLHVAVQKVIDNAAPETTGILSRDKLEASLEEAWESDGPDVDSYADDYKRIAMELVRFYARVANDLTLLPVPELRLAIAGGEIVVTPHQVGKSADGAVVMRRVNTGHQRSDDLDSLATAAFHLAATDHSPGCKVELVYLSDAEVLPVEFTALVLKNRRRSIDEMGAAVRTGVFPLKEGPTCPRCPAYFICGKLPDGEFVKKFPA